MTAFAKSERRDLADLLLRLGPDEPTLCEGWTTRDLAAHLVVRERRPDSAAGLIVPPLRERGERIRLAKASRPFEEIVGEVRRPPWWSPISNPLLDEMVNTAEFFIHHEDCRRGRPGWEPRTLDPPLCEALWRSTRLVGRLALRRAKIAVRVREAGGLGEFTVGGDDPPLTAVGSAGELALFLSGRQRAARVELNGPAEQAERLRTAKLA